MNNDDNATAQMIVKLADMSLRVLSARLLTVLSLIASIGLFIAALCVEPTYPALAVAAAFAVLVFLPVMFRERR
jgi:hypothetical protein